MPYDNTLYLMGYLGSDPEGGYFADGNAHAKISVACNDRRRDKDGNETDHVECLPCCCAASLPNLRWTT